MKKLSPVGMKWLKIVHISLVALFFGGIMSSLALNMGILFVGQTIIGIFVVDSLMLANMTLLETEKALALTNPEFLHNQTLRQYAIYVQVAVTVFILCVSVFRPWKKKKQAVAS
jgi:hypothetical protein